MVAFGGIVGFLIFALWIWAIFDCISTDASLCRNLPKGVWLILVIFLPTIGSLAWLLLGRPERAGWRPGSTQYSGHPGNPLGLEDHPRYTGSFGVSDRRSAELDEQLAQWEREQAEKRALESGDKPAIEAPPADRDLDAWEADLARREDELRRRELEQRERDVASRERQPDDE